jgi:hypothetical protein
VETLDTVVGRLPCRLTRGWYLAAQIGGTGLTSIRALSAQEK